VVDMLQVLLVIIASLVAAAYAAGEMSRTAARPSWTGPARLHHLLGTVTSHRLGAVLRNVYGCPWFAPSLAWARVALAPAWRRPWPLAGPPGGGAGPPTIDAS
jgi:hypothetical protein